MSSSPRLRRLRNAIGSRTAGAFFLVGLTAGCVSAPTGDVDLGTEVPTNWTAAPASDTGQPDGSAPENGVALGDVSMPEAWWTAWGSDELATVVEAALAANPTLAAAAANLDAAAAQARIAGAARFVQIDAGLGANRQRQNFVGLPIPGSSGGVLTSNSTLINASLNASWEADLWGRVRAANRAALAELAASDADLAAARLSIAATAAKSWLALVEAEAQIELAEAALANRLNSQARVERRYRAGLVPSVELRLAESEVELSRAQVAARQRLRGALGRQLEALLGRYPAGRLEVPRTLPALPEPAPLGLPSELLRRRPDLLAAERRLDAAGARVAEAKASRYPRFSLTASLGRSSNDLQDLTQGDFSIWSLAGNLVAPIFQAGRLKAGVELAEAGYRASEALYVDTVLRAFREVETALEAEIHLNTEVDASRAAAEQAEASQRLAQRRYGNGVADYLTVLTSERQAYDARSRQLDAERRRLEARADLYLALGGGFQPTIIEAAAPEAEEESAR